MNRTGNNTAGCAAAHVGGAPGSVRSAGPWAGVAATMTPSSGRQAIQTSPHLAVHAALVLEHGTQAGYTLGAGILQRGGGQQCGSITPGSAWQASSWDWRGRQMEQASCKEHACNSTATGRCKGLDCSMRSKAAEAGTQGRRPAGGRHASYSAAQQHAGRSQFWNSCRLPHPAPSIHAEALATALPASSSPPTLWPQGAKAVKASGSAHTMQMSSMAAGRLVPQSVGLEALLGAGLITTAPPCCGPSLLPPPPATAPPAAMVGWPASPVRSSKHQYCRPW